ncbi:flippase-like domain-containing protein [bacterium]|nr:flippase-like domain-containing protein [bacterium]
MRKNIKRQLLLFTRIIFSVGLFAVLIILNFKNLESIPELLKSLNIAFLLIGILFYFFGIALESPRWHSLLAAHRIYIPQSYLLGSVLIGFFYGTLLPTTIGGDAYRGIDMHKSFKIPLNENILAIYLGRFFGILSGLLFLVISLCLGMYKHLNESFALGLAVVLPIVFFIIIITIFPKKFKIDILFSKIKFLKRFSGNVLEFSNVLDSYKHKGKSLALSFMYSLLGNLSTFISFYFIGLALKIRLNFLSYLFIVPITWTISNIPITLGGIGLRENTIVVLLKEFGISSSSALTFSLIVLMVNLLIAILGGLIHIIRNAAYKHKKEI